MWNKMAQKIRKVAKETLRKSRGFGFMGKESWWWNESVQSKVRVKNNCFKEWSRCKNDETWESIRKLRMRPRR